MNENIKVLNDEQSSLRSEITSYKQIIEISKKKIDEKENERLKLVEQSKNEKNEYEKVSGINYYKS